MWSCYLARSPYWFTQSNAKEQSNTATSIKAQSSIKAKESSIKAQESALKDKKAALSSTKQAVSQSQSTADSRSQEGSSEITSLQSLSARQRDIIIAYAYSMDAFIKNGPGGGPQQYTSDYGDLHAISNDTVTIKYFKGRDAYGHLSAINQIVDMQVKLVDDNGTLLFTDNHTGKMSKITFLQITQDQSNYIDEHNQLSN